MRRPALLVIVRHGESVRNLAKKGSVYFADDEARSTVRGIPDHLIELTTDGKEQARRTGSYLAERFDAFDYAYHSGYRRTISTLEEILAAFPQEQRGLIRVRQNPFIRERDPGYTYDMTEDEASAVFPYLREYWATFGGFFARPPGGESLADVTGRVYNFLNMLFRDRTGQRILVVTHGGTIRCFRYLLERWTYDRALRWPNGQSPHNCGITVYEYDRRVERLSLVEYNTVCDANALPEV